MSYSITPEAVLWRGKPVKGADPASFVVLGTQYGRDGSSAWFEKKRVRLKAKVGGTLDRFRQIGPAMASDGAWLYFGTKQTAPPRADPPLDFGKLTFRAFHGGPGHERGINMDDGVLSDGSCHYLHTWSQDWAPVPSAAVEPLEPDVDEFGDGRYVSDGVFHAYRGAPIDAGSAEGVVEAIAPDVLAIGEQLWLGAEPLSGWRRDQIRWACGPYLHAGDVVLEIDGREGQVRNERRVSCADDLQAAVQRFLDAIVPKIAAVLDRCLPVATNPWDIDFDELAAPARAVPFALLSVTDDRVVLDAEGARIEGCIGGFFELACRVWAAARGEPDRFVPYMNFLGMLPDTAGVRLRVLRAVTDEALDVAAALFASSQEEPHVETAHLLVYEVLRRIREPQGGATGEQLARLPQGLVGALRYRDRRHEFSVTTNLAVVKHIVQGDLLADSDPRVRIEMIDTLIGATMSSAKGEKSLPLAVPALIRHLDIESVAGVREALWSALDACTVKSTVTAEVRGVDTYAWLRQACERLLAEQVNVHINRARRIEALHGLGLVEAAAQAERELRETAPADNPCPGAYANREVFATFEAAAAAGRVRAGEVRQVGRKS
ncbi:MAG: hypothetical protein AB8H80_02340 [Planctomycetota bacterium]